MYLQDEGAMLDLIFRSLSVDYQALYDEYDSAHKLWSYLKKKYQQTDPKMANEYMTLTQKFSIGNPGITDAWDKLKEYRRRLCAVDTDSFGTYHDRAQILILMCALPKLYTSTIDTLDAKPDPTVEEKLKHLQTKENRLATEDREDMAFAGSYRTRGAKDLSRHSRVEEGGDSGYAPSCYIWDKKHFV